MISEILRRLTLTIVLMVLIEIVTSKITVPSSHAYTTGNCCCRQSYCRWYNYTTKEYMSVSFGEEICFDTEQSYFGLGCDAEKLCEYMIPTGNWEVSSGCFGDCDWKATTSICDCPPLCIYGENSEEVELLRYFRDNVLTQTPEGQEIIRLYYEWSPAIIKAMEEDEAFKAQVKEMVNGILELIGGGVE